MNKFTYSDITVYNSVYKYIDSNMYIIIRNNCALVVDPHKDEAAEELFREHAVSDITILLTHEHSDHISGIHWLQSGYKSSLICTENCADYISDIRNTRPILMTFILEQRDMENGTNVLEEFNREYISCSYIADKSFSGNLCMDWNGYSLEFTEIKGHSRGSCIINLDNRLVFTGDSLLKDYPVITRFPGGNTKKYKNETLPFLNGYLRDDMFILSGHGAPFFKKEIMVGGEINVEFK